MLFAQGKQKAIGQIPARFKVFCGQGLFVRCVQHRLNNIVLHRCWLRIPIAAVRFKQSAHIKGCNIAIQTFAAFTFKIESGSFGQFEERAYFAKREALLLL